MEEYEMEEYEMEVIERDPPFTGIARERQSMGIVWFDDPFPYFQSDDAGEWIDGIERKYGLGKGDGKTGRTPYHFYVTADGEVFEGLGWGAYSSWHDMGKNQDQPQHGGNSIAVLYLGPGEQMTDKAKRAGQALVEAHRVRYPSLLRNIRYYDVFNVTPAGAGGKMEPDSMAEWIAKGCFAPVIEEEEVQDEPEIEASPVVASKPAPKRQRKKAAGGTAADPDAG